MGVEELEDVLQGGAWSIAVTACPRAGCVFSQGVTHAQIEQAQDRVYREENKSDGIMLEHQDSLPFDCLGHSFYVKLHLSGQGPPQIQKV